MSIAGFSVKNPTLINMIMIIVFFVGIYTMIDMPKEEMPAIDMGRFIINVAYRGVTPSEIETLIVNKIEEEISDVDDVDYIESTSKEGLATIMVIMDSDADLEQAWNDINTELDKINDLPQDAEDPIVIEINMREINEICSLVIAGDFTDNALRDIAEDFKDVIKEVEHVSKVEIAGTREREIWVEADPVILNENNIDVNEISSAIINRNQNTPGGSIDFGKNQYLLRTTGEYDNIQEINETVLIMEDNGSNIVINDVATVTDTVEERVTISKLNGVQGVSLSVYKKAEGNIIAVMDEIKKTADDFATNIPGLDIEVRNDGSIDVRDSIYNLGSNAIIGIILVFFILFIFLGWKNAILAAWGIPFSFMLTFYLMRQFDVTMNNLSLFALILVLGMIVDDAIIVLENVHRHREKGLSLKQAVIKGTDEIMWPVISAVLTTMAAFLPMIFLQGNMGKFLAIFPIVVSIALAASLFECLVILPSHISEFGKSSKQKKVKQHNKITRILQERYETIAQWALGHRIIIVLVSITLFVLSISALSTGLVQFQFFPTHSSSTLVLNLKTVSGLKLEKTNEITEGIESYIAQMKENVDVEAVVTNVGQLTEHHQIQKETNYAELKIDLLDEDDMVYTHTQIETSIRSYLKTIPELTSFAFKEGERGGAPTGNDVELRIKGEDFNTMENIDVYLSDILSDIGGLSDIESNLLEGKNEIHVVPRYDKIKLYGINESQITSLLATATYGRTVSQFRGSGIEEYNIIVKFKEELIENLTQLQSLKLRSSSGELISINEIVDFVITKGYSEINHYDQKRVLTITASVTDYVINNKKMSPTPSEITAILRGNNITGERGLLFNFSTLYPGYTLEYGGSTEQQSETYNSLYLALAIALLLIFTILSTQFGSYVQPLIVMFTIPFALIGVIFGLMVTGLPFSVMTLISVVALAGVVVNDSLVLVDFVNKERERGIDRWNSLINAGKTRLRPILMTTITTIAGFMPMILSTSSASEDWKPLAVAMAFGLAFATTITLLVIPVIYSYVDSFFGRLKLTRFSKHISFREAMIIRETERLEQK